MKLDVCGLGACQKADLQRDHDDGTIHSINSDIAPLQNNLYISFMFDRYLHGLRVHYPCGWKSTNREIGMGLL